MQIEDREEGRQPTPLWMLLVAGFLIGGALDSHGRRSELTETASAPPTERLDLSSLTARELRRLPGIGARIALALVEARWEHAPGDPPLLLGDVLGIGPSVEGRVRAWLEEREGGGRAPAPDRR